MILDWKLRGLRDRLHAAFDRAIGQVKPQSRQVPSPRDEQNEEDEIGRAIDREIEAIRELSDEIEQLTTDICQLIDERRDEDHARE